MAASRRRDLRPDVAALVGGYSLALGSYFGALALGRARVGPLGFAREVTPYLFVPLPALLTGSVMLRARAAFLLTLPPLLLLVVVWIWRFRPRSAAAAGPRFRVFSLNAGGNAHGGDAVKLLRAVGAVDADIVALQELTPELLAAVSRALSSRYPHCFGTWEASVLSRLPLSGGRAVSFVGRGSDAQRVEIEVGDRRVTLFNVHVTRPGYQTLGRFRVGRLVRLVRDYDPTLRDAHVGEVERQLDHVAGPHLVTCDLNGTEWSSAYRRLSGRLGDSFREVAPGFGHTYPAKLRCGPWWLRLPLVRIDYIFHSPELLALECYVGPESGSDHLPVVAELAFR